MKRATLLFVITCLFLVAESADQLITESMFCLAIKNPTVANEDESLTGFLNKHHLKGLQNEEDDSGDMQLPFKTTHHHSGPSCRVIIPATYQTILLVQPLSVKAYFIPNKEFEIPPGFLSTIFQPPRG